MTRKKVTESMNFFPSVGPRTRHPRPTRPRAVGEYVVEGQGNDDDPHICEGDYAHQNPSVNSKPGRFRLWIPYTPMLVKPRMRVKNQQKVDHDVALRQ